MARGGSALRTLVAGTMALPFALMLGLADHGSTTFAAHAAPSSAVEDPRTQWDAWVFAGYERAPALVLGLAAMLALLPLAFAGRLVRRRHETNDSLDPIEVTEASEPPKEATRVLKRPSQPREVQTRRDEGMVRPAEAWIEVAGPERRRYGLGRGMVRIEREDDNDIRLPFATVHRYHAVLHRTPEAEYVITDLSSADGNGLVVNRRRLGEARLQDGDTLQLGEAVLVFKARPVSDVPERQGDDGRHNT